MPSVKPPLSAIFGLAPKEAVRWFDDKPTFVSEGWESVEAITHQSGFTVAQSAGFQVVDDIKAALQKARDAGWSVKQFQQALIPLLRAKGWWGRAVDPKTGEILKTYPGTNTPVRYGSPARLRLIYDVNMSTAYAAGRRERQEKVKAQFPYWRYVAVMDSRTRPAHAALNGMVFRADSPFWQVNYPPLGYRCRCTVQALSTDDLRETGETVQDGGNFTERTVRINKAGETRTQRGWQLRNGQTFYPDPGWER